MVESPTYFQAIGPVLEVLSKMELDRFVLRDSIVAGDSVEKPDYFMKVKRSMFPRESSGEDDLLDDESELGDQSNDVDSEYDDDQDLNDLSPVEALKAKVRKVKTQIEFGLDPAQKEAFRAAFENRVAIIQGPPGCGKTFLGLKLAQVLLEWQLPRPILVITYKNHALDEFLKQAAALSRCGIDKVNI